MSWSPSLRAKHKGKDKMNDEPKKYTAMKILLLVKFYVDVMEDAIIGNFQKFKMF